MIFSEYVKSLLPTFESNRIKENLTNLATELDSQTVPSFQTVGETFPAKWKWKDTNVKTLVETVEKSYKGKVPARDANGLEIVHYVLVNMQSTLPFVTVQSEKLFEKQVSSANLSFNKANLIQYAEAAEFVVNYARVLFNYVTAAELAKLDSNRDLRDGVGPEDLDFLLLRRESFAAALNIMAIEVKELKDGIKSIPTSVIDEATEDDMKVIVGAGKLDPFGFAVLPFPLSIVYRAGLSIANWQMERYERALSESKVLEYRTIVLKQRIEEGTGDALIEKQLEEEEAELKVLKRKLAKIEEKYGL